MRQKKNSGEQTSLFFAPEIEAQACLSEEETHHARHVLRLNRGSAIEILDGKGKRFTARLANLRGKSFCLEEICCQEDCTEAEQQLTIAVAPPKNRARLEWIVEKATELGVREILLLDCEHSERKLSNTERLEKLAIAALKQSKGNLFLPRIKQLSFSDLLKEEIQRYPQKYIACCALGYPYIDSSSLDFQKGKTLVCIGPEGDFSMGEMQLALAEGFRALRLGPVRLRTETAALYVASIFKQNFDTENHG